MRFDRPSPAPPLSRAVLVMGLYSGLALVAIVLSAGRGDPDVYRLVERPAWLPLLVSPLVGLAFGLGIVGLTRLADARWAWARELNSGFRDILGPVTTRELVVLAASSAIGEELLFRGALLPWWGLWPQAIAFAILHIRYDRALVRFLPWTASSLVLGLALGWMAQITGDVGGPIVAHFVINLLNLRYITQR